MKANNKIYKQLAEKYDLPLVAIKAICDSPLQYIAESIYKGEMLSFNLIGFGKIAVQRSLSTKGLVEQKKQEIQKRYEFYKRLREEG